MARRDEGFVGKTRGGISIKEIRPVSEITALRQKWIFEMGSGYLDSLAVGSIMKAMFTREQRRVISGILADLGQVCAGSIVVPFLFPSFLSGELTSIIFGSLLSFLFWTLSVTSVKNI